jgi:hypothetical protein
MSVFNLIPLNLKPPSLKEHNHFNTYVKGSKITKIPIDQYLKEKAALGSNKPKA